MLVNKLVTYKALDLQQPTIPTRSRLYCLEPIGVGTPNVESLTGYVQRLAQAHGVSSGKLIFSEISVLTGQRYLATKNKYERSLPATNTPALNGTKSMATRWVQALETLTQQTNLNSLTMLPWGEVISQRGLLRRYRAWCPLCYDQWRVAGQVIYEPLIWALDVVIICPSHHQNLQTYCPYCQQQLPLLSVNSRPGFCSKCEAWLGVPKQAKAFNSKLLSKAELDWQLVVVENVGELIATTPHLLFPLPRARIKEAISSCIDQTVGGKATTFAQLFKIFHKTVISWQTGEEIPKMNALLQIIYWLEIPLIDFLTKEDIAINSNRIATQLESKKQRRRENYQKQPLNLKRIQQTLLAALEEKPPPALTKVIKKLGYTGSGTFYKYFRDLCHRIVARHTNYRKVKQEERKLFLVSVLEGNEIPPPSMKEVARRIGAIDSSLHIEFPSLSQAISARYMEYRKMVRVQKEEQLRTSVREIALALHAQGINPHSQAVGKFLSSPRILRNQVANTALHEIRRELGYNK